MGYDEREVRRVVYCTQLAFWVGAPLFAGSLAASWMVGELVWPTKLLWVVVVSSGFLTAREYRLMPRECGESPAEARRRL